MSKDYVRLEININDETAGALKELSKSSNRSITEVIRQAVGVYYYLVKAMSNGETVTLVNKKKTETKLTF